MADLVEVAACAAHEVNRVYCCALGDQSQVPWPEAPDWQKDSARAGVRAIQRNPEMTPVEQHACWLEEKRADGWRHGPVKDLGKKEHPCFVPFEVLPMEQQVKDTLFGAVVRGVLAFYGEQK